ncbi:MAG: hypothetical protein CL930_16205 [Deltaproteobacteria bacterium]|nr:hypothetical protein [Deltaproteobacteria bacterium]
MIGSPDGGTLYFIDMLGALIGTPLSWVFGPAVAYNGVLVLRVAAAGLGGQVLSESVVGRGPHNMVAGIAMATLPFMLAEMSNGISEVVAIHWVIWSLWAGHLAWQQNTWASWRRAGIILGFTTVASFYYGLVAGMVMSVLFLALGWRSIRSGFRPTWDACKHPVLALGVAALVSVPCWLVFQWTLQNDASLIIRPQELAVGWMLSHNAVDPRTYLMWGDFQSVDLASYGEAFRHTGYLRWTVVFFAIVGVMKNPKLRPWAIAAIVSLLMGLGPMLYWGDWVQVGGRAVTLPFYWMQVVLPDVAITHPLRLSVGGQIIVAVLAAGGVASLSSRIVAPIIGLVVGLESVIMAPVQWPVPTSTAAIPDIYEGIPDGAVLDLPGSVGKTMATSQYFWFQTRHGRPIPYSPNARLDSCRDLDVQSAFTDPYVRQSEHRVVEHPAKGPDLYQKHLSTKYAAIVLHTNLEARAGLPSDYEPVLTTVFGPPQIDGERKVWIFGEARP